MIELRVIESAVNRADSPFPWNALISFATATAAMHVALLIAAVGLGRSAWLYGGFAMMMFLVIVLLAVSQRQSSRAFSAMRHRIEMARVKTELRQRDRTLRGKLSLLRRR